MLLSEHQIGTLLTDIWPKTARNEVHWEKTGDRYYTSLTPNTVLSISTNAPIETKVPSATRPPVPPDIAFRVRIIADKEDILGELEAAVGTTYFAPAKTLYEYIDKVIAERVFNQLLEAVRQPGLIGQPSARASLQPTAEQQVGIMAKMEGKWHVNYSTGQEVATIDKGGNYNVENYSDNPKFILTIIACNDLLSKAEVAKDFRDGRRHSIEVLHISTDSMIGAEKGTQLRLRYTKIPPVATKK